MAEHLRSYQGGHSIRERLTAKIIECNYSIKNSLLRLCHSLLFRENKKPAKVEKLLIFRQGGLGETITAIPALKAIRAYYPNAEIHLLTNVTTVGRPDMAEMLPVGFFKKILYFKNPKLFEIIKLIKPERYDMYIELPLYIVSTAFELRSMLSARLSGIGYGAGWHISSTFFLKRQQQQLYHFEYNAPRLLRILNEYGIDTGNYQDEKNVIQDINSHNKKNKVCLIISAGRPQNKWNIENYKKVAQYFLSKGWEILLSGGEEDKHLGDDFPKSENLKNSCGDVEVQHLQSLYAGCDLIISNDTGPLHVAALTGKPIIAIFSARDYGGKWFPEGENIHILQNAKVPCSACFTETCVNVICMESITPAMVIAKAAELVEF